jgi:hypothetical protein
VRQTLRYALAVILGWIVSDVVGILLALVIDILLGDVTGGRWALNAPNVFLVLCEGLVMGYTAGAIAGRRGKLVGAITAFFPLILLTAISIAMNRDILGHIAEDVDTEPALWVWIALLPAIIGGQIGVKHGSRGVRYAILGISGVTMIGFYIGSAAFHVYTIIVAYEVAGFGAAFISAGTPPIAELYWAIRIWRTAGYITNQYDMLFLLLVGLMLFGIVLVSIATLLEKREAAIHHDTPTA